MKSIDEVIRALECCLEIGLCKTECPYQDDCLDGREKRDALHYLRQYAELLAEVRQGGQVPCLNAETEGPVPPVSPGISGRWIPVMEKLPPPWKEVLTTYEFEGRRYVQTAEYAGQNDENGRPLFCSDSDEYAPRHYEFIYIAWMPLPEPMKKIELEVRSEK